MRRFPEMEIRRLLSEQGLEVNQLRPKSHITSSQFEPRWMNSQKIAPMKILPVLVSIVLTSISQAEDKLPQAELRATAEVERKSHLSPDGKWRVAIDLEDWDERKVITKISIAPTGKPADTTVLFAPEDGPAAFGDGLFWNPDSNRIAIMNGHSPRFSVVLVFHLKKSKWLPVELPELNAKERARLDAEGFHERHQRFEPVRWENSDTLIVRDWGLFTKEDDSTEIHAEHAVQILPDGTAKVVRSREMPAE